VRETKQGKPSKASVMSILYWVAQFLISDPVQAYDDLVESGCLCANA